MTTPQEVRDFWFDMRRSVRERARVWMGSAPEIDPLIRERFAADVQLAAHGGLEVWENDAQSCLALILLLDRFTMSIYRGTAKYFEASAMALPIAMKGIRQSFDQGVRPVPRLFYYFPLLNCENAHLQDRAVTLFQATETGGMGDEAQFVAASVRCAFWHKKAIEKFGRYPERNALLGRTSTPAEKEFLKDGLPRFAAGPVHVSPKSSLTRRRK